MAQAGATLSSMASLIDQLVAARQPQDAALLTKPAPGRRDITTHVSHNPQQLIDYGMLAVDMLSQVPPAKGSVYGTDSKGGDVGGLLSDIRSLAESIRVHGIESMATSQRGDSGVVVESLTPELEGAGAMPAIKPLKGARLPSPARPARLAPRATQDTLTQDHTAQPEEVPQSHSSGVFSRTISRFADADADAANRDYKQTAAALVMTLRGDSAAHQFASLQPAGPPLASAIPRTAAATLAAMESIAQGSGPSSHVDLHTGSERDTHKGYQAHRTPASHDDESSSRMAAQYVNQADRSGRLQLPVPVPSHPDTPAAVVHYTGTSLHTPEAARYLFHQPTAAGVDITSPEEARVFNQPSAATVLRTALSPMPIPLPLGRTLNESLTETVDPAAAAANIRMQVLSKLATTSSSNAKTQFVMMTDRGHTLPSSLEDFTSLMQDYKHQEYDGVEAMLRYVVGSSTSTATVNTPSMPHASTYAVVDASGLAAEVVPRYTDSYVPEPSLQMASGAAPSTPATAGVGVGVPTSTGAVVSYVTTSYSPPHEARAYEYVSGLDRSVERVQEKASREAKEIVRLAMLSLTQAPTTPQPQPLRVPSGAHRSSPAATAPQAAVTVTQPPSSLFSPHAPWNMLPSGTEKGVPGAAEVVAGAGAHTTSTFELMQQVLNKMSAVAERGKLHAKKGKQHKPDTAAGTVTSKPVQPPAATTTSSKTSGSVGSHFRPGPKPAPAAVVVSGKTSNTAAVPAPHKEPLSIMPSASHLHPTTQHTGTAKQLLGGPPPKAQRGSGSTGMPVMSQAERSRHAAKTAASLSKPQKREARTSKPTDAASTGSSLVLREGGSTATPAASGVARPASPSPHPASSMPTRPPPPPPSFDSVTYTAKPGPATSGSADVMYFPSETQLMDAARRLQAGEPFTTSAPSNQYVAEKKGKTATTGTVTTNKYPAYPARQRSDSFEPTVVIDDVDQLDAILSIVETGKRQAAPAKRSPTRPAALQVPSGKSTDFGSPLSPLASFTAQLHSALREHRSPPATASPSASGSPAGSGEEDAEAGYLRYKARVPSHLSVTALTADADGYKVRVERVPGTSKTVAPVPNSGVSSSVQPTTTGTTTGSSQRVPVSMPHTPRLPPPTSRLRAPGSRGGTNIPEPNPSSPPPPPPSESEFATPPPPPSDALPQDRRGVNRTGTGVAAPSPSKGRSPGLSPTRSFRTYNSMRALHSEDASATREVAEEETRTSKHTPAAATRLPTHAEQAETEWDADSGSGAGRTVGSWNRPGGRVVGASRSDRSGGVYRTAESFMIDAAALHPDIPVHGTLARAIDPSRPPVVKSRQNHPNTRAPLLPSAVRRASLTPADALPSYSDAVSSVHEAAHQLAPSDIHNAALLNVSPDEFASMTPVQRMLATLSSPQAYNDVIMHGDTVSSFEMFAPAEVKNRGVDPFADAERRRREVMRM